MKSIVIIIMSVFGLLKAEAMQQFNISEYQGKVVYLDFWASWCVPCRQSFPWLNSMQEKYAAKGLVIVAVNLDKDAHLAAEFLKEYPANFSIIYDPTGELAKKHQIPGMPSSILFNRSGMAIQAHSGFFKSKAKLYELEIQKALGLIREELSIEN